MQRKQLLPDPDKPRHLISAVTVVAFYLCNILTVDDLAAYFVLVISNGRLCQMSSCL